MDSPEEQPLKDQKLKPKKRTLKEKLLYIKENITVEPVLACYVVPGHLARLATQNLNLDKACRVNLAYGDTVCDALIAREEAKYAAEELAVQQLISSMEVWKHILLTTLPCFLILFLGAWSDRTGKRKICILMPIIGDLLMCLSNMLNVYFFYELPVQMTMFLEAIFPALCGAWVVAFMGAFSYISDVSSEESRTFRVGVANLCLTAGAPIGTALSGVLLKSTGYYGVFGISTLMYLFSLIYGYYYIKDPERPVTEKESKTETNQKCFLRTFFDIQHVKDTLTVAFKKGPNHRRKKLILVFAAIAFIYGPGHGENTVRYLFTRTRFNWDALKYSFFNTFYICMHGLGALITISIFSRRLKWNDAVLGIISNTSHVVGALIIAFASKGSHMYIAVAIETFNATAFTALRSISSKQVTRAELGKMVSIFNLMETVTSMVFGPMYSWIYMVTVPINPGIVFFVSVFLTFPAIGIFAWFYIQKGREDQDTLKDVTKPKTEEKADQILLSSIELANETIKLSQA